MNVVIVQKGAGVCGKLGFMPLTERYKPTECLKLAVEAKEIGFDFIWVDDRFSPAPPLTEASFAWTWMSSALQATEKTFVSTGVAAPTMRYNPAVVAQAFATMGVMYPERVGIGVGSGGELNSSRYSETYSDENGLGYAGGCFAACLPARRPAKTQSAIDEPLAK